MLKRLFKQNKIYLLAIAIVNFLVIALDMRLKTIVYTLSSDKISKII